MKTLVYFCGLLFLLIPGFVKAGVENAVSVSPHDNLIDGMINICNRGIIGDRIAIATGATNCKQVSRNKMENLKDLDASKINSNYLQRKEFKFLYSLENLNLSNSNIKKIESLRILNAIFLHLPLGGLGSLGLFLA